jgi:cbb3-type cytochrome oxidase subunit 1
MPPLTRWFLKSALVYLVAALLAGTLVAARNVWLLPPLVTAFTPVYLHLFMVGWVTQLIFGVVFWMFPKYSKEKPRGSETLGWATYLLLNVGLLLRVLGEPLNALQPGTLWGWLLVVSAMLQWLAGFSFVANTWGRVQGTARARQRTGQA